ncbi:MAG: MarR family transcriptional regulator [Anaerolinea sp.]|nr:MarR family transcriptional regulator [Anaerolinea sp.]
MPLPPLYGATIELRILMAMIARLAMRHHDEHFGTGSLGISGLQYGILRVLSLQSFTLSELSKKFMLDPSTLVPVVDALEGKGLVRRGKDPNDRRRAPLSITESGTATLNHVPLSHEDDLFYQRVAVMGEEKIHRLVALLRELINGMPDGEAMLEEISTRIHAYTCEQPSEEEADPPII